MKGVKDIKQISKIIDFTRILICHSNWGKFYMFERPYHPFVSPVLVVGPDDVVSGLLAVVGLPFERVFGPSPCSGAVLVLGGPRRSVLTMPLLRLIPLGRFLYSPPLPIVPWPSVLIGGCP